MFVATLLLCILASKKSNFSFDDSNVLSQSYEDAFDDDTVIHTLDSHITRRGILSHYFHYGGDEEEENEEDEEVLNFNGGPSFYDSDDASNNESAYTFYTHSEPPQIEIVTNYNAQTLANLRGEAENENLQAASTLAAKKRAATSITSTSNTTSNTGGTTQPSQPSTIANTPTSAADAPTAASPQVILKVVPEAELEKDRAFYASWFELLLSTSILEMVFSVAFLIPITVAIISATIYCCLKQVHLKQTLRKNDHYVSFNQ